MRTLAAALLATLLLAGCSSPTPPVNTSDATHIDLAGDRFRPSSTTFKSDQAAHFQNKDAHDHTVTVHGPSGQVVHDRTLHPGETDEFKLPSAGSYHVFCKIHDGMAMTVTVT